LKSISILGSPSCLFNWNELKDIQSTTNFSDSKLNLSAAVKSILLTVIYPELSEFGTF